jgi:hypothetical protein
VLEDLNVNSIDPDNIYLRKIKIKPNNNFPNEHNYDDEIHNFAN